MDQRQLNEVATLSDRSEYEPVQVKPYEPDGVSIVAHRYDEQRGEFRPITDFKPYEGGLPKVVDAAPAKRTVPQPLRRRDRLIVCSRRPRTRTSSSSRAGPGDDPEPEPEPPLTRGRHPRRRGVACMAAERKDPSRRRPLEPRYEQRRWAQQRYEALERLRRELDEREARERPLFDPEQGRAA